MSFVELSELLRNLGLLFLAAIGVWFAGRQFMRARRKDDFEIFTKAVELLNSDNEQTVLGGLLMLRDLERSPDVGELAKQLLNDYIYQKPEIVTRLDP